MATFDELKKKFTNMLNPVKQGLSNVVNDDKGWIRQGKFTPIKQITAEISNTALPFSPIKFDTQTGKFSKSWTLGGVDKFIGENIVQPGVRLLPESYLSAKQLITGKQQTPVEVKGGVSKFLVGEKPLTTFQQQTQDFSKTLSGYGVPQKYSTPIAVGGMVAGKWLDVLPGVDDIILKGGKKALTPLAKKQAEEFAVKQIEKRLLAQGVKKSVVREQAEKEAKILVEKRISKTIDTTTPKTINPSASGEVGVPKAENIRTMTIKTNEGKNEYVAQIGNRVKDRVGRTIGFKATVTSPNFKNVGEMEKWITKNTNNIYPSIKKVEQPTINPSASGEVGVPKMTTKNGLKVIGDWVELPLPDGFENQFRNKITGEIKPLSELNVSNLPNTLKIDLTPQNIIKKIDNGTNGLPGAELTQPELDVIGKWLKTNGDTSLRGKITEAPNGTRDVIFGTIKNRNFKGQTEYLLMADSGPYKGAFRLSSTPIDSKFFGTRIVGEVGKNQAKAEVGGVKTENIKPLVQEKTLPLEQTKIAPQLQTLPKQTVLPEAQIQKETPPILEQPKIKQSLPKIVSLSGTGKIGQVPKPTSTGVINSAKQFANKIYTEVVDRFHPLSQVAKGTGREQLMENALTSHYGAGSTANYHINHELSPILQLVDANDLRAYTIAQRDIELAGRNIKGSDAKAAQNIINELTAKYGDLYKIKYAANQLYNYQSSMVKKYLVDTGIMSQESFDAMMKTNQKYVPFKRVMDEVDDFLGMTPQQKGVGSVGSQNVIKKIKGSERQIVDPLESIVENTYKMVGLGKRNQVARTIANLKDVLPNSIKEFSGEIGKKPVISVFENGKVKHYLVPEDVAIAAKGLENESLNAIVKILSYPTQLFRATATGLNPEFMLPNTVRDLQSAFVNEGMNPLKFISGLAHLIKKDDVYQEFLKAGGQTSSIAIDRDMLTKTVKEISSKKGVDISQFANPLKLLQRLGEWSEQPTRIGMFESKLKKGIKQGLSKEDALIQAANSAQSGTVNFARRGSKMQAANALVAFLNARVQGTDQLFRSLKKDPTGVGLRLALLTQAPAVALYAWNRGFNSYNDDNVVSKWDKQNNFIFMLSDQPIPSLGGAQFIKIPKGDVGKFANPTENFLAYADGRDSNIVESIKKSVLGLLPVSNWGDVVPTSLKPIIETKANYSFFKEKPIVPEYMQNLPPEYQRYQNTPEIYKKAGEKLGVSPLKLQNLTSGYLTGYEKIGTPLLSNLVGGEDQRNGQDINYTPVARRFLGGAKMSQEDVIKSESSKQESLKFKINDIKGAVNRGDMPFDAGVKQIQKLTSEVSGTGQTNINKPSQATSNTQYFQLDGKMKDINLDTSFQKPQLTGDSVTDKTIISKYNSSIQTQISDLVDYAKSGNMSQDELVKRVNELQSQKILKAKKPRKIKFKKIKIPKIKAIKLKKPKQIKIKKPKVLKMPSVKRIKLKKIA